MFFSALFAPHSRGAFFNRGFSLVELLVSVLLIAAIAVLSLPTFHDFAPHATYPGEPRSLPADESAVATIPGKDPTVEEEPFTLQAGDGDDAQSRAAPPTDARTPSQQGGKPQ